MGRVGEFILVIVRVGNSTDVTCFWFTALELPARDVRVRPPIPRRPRHAEQRGVRGEDVRRWQTQQSERVRRVKGEVKGVKGVKGVREEENRGDHLGILPEGGRSFIFPRHDSWGSAGSDLGGHAGPRADAGGSGRRAKAAARALVGADEATRRVPRLRGRVRRVGRGVGVRGGR